MSNGISYAEVEAIVGRRVAGVQNEVARVAARVADVEAELAGIGSAIDGMTRTLAHKLDGVSHGQHELLQVQRSTHLMTQEQFVAANAQLSGLHQTSAHGFQTVAGGLDHVSSDVKLVDGSVRQMTIAMAQMEVIRVMNDAKGPVDRIHGFAAEIDERFAKAVENVYTVRAQYDQLLATAMSDYERKLRILGEHIFAVYEQDFRVHVELPLTAPARAFVSLPLEVDDRRLQARSDVLESNLLESSHCVLEPLLQTQRALEHTMASKYATGIASSLGEVAVPVDVRVYDQGTGRPPDVIAGMRSERAAPVGDEGTSVYFKLGEQTPGVRAAMQSRSESVARACRFRAMTAAEREELMTAVRMLSDSRAIDPELVEGYADYLDEFGLEIGEAVR